MVVEARPIAVVVPVAGAPALRLEAPPGIEPSCDVHAVVGDAAVVGVNLAGDQVSDPDALCGEVAAALAMVVEQLPESD